VILYKFGNFRHLDVVLYVLYVNAYAHSAFLIHEFLAKKSISVLPFYSSDLSFCDFLFPKIKMRLKIILEDNYFEMIDNVKKVVTDLMNNITESDFLSCMKSGQLAALSLRTTLTILKGTVLFLMYRVLPQPTYQ